MAIEYKKGVTARVSDQMYDEIEKLASLDEFCRESGVRYIIEGQIMECKLDIIHRFRVP